MPWSWSLSESLFVYGTLAPGQPNEHVLADLVGTWTPATVRGSLLPDGWGAALGFPAIELDEAGPVVAGLLFRSASLPEHWERLDDFEGEGYSRVLTTVLLEDGSPAPAYVYVLRRPKSP